MIRMVRSLTELVQMRMYVVYVGLPHVAQQCGPVSLELHLLLLLQIVPEEKPSICMIFFRRLMGIHRGFMRIDNRIVYTYRYLMEYEPIWVKNNDLIVTSLERQYIGKLSPHDLISDELMIDTDSYSGVRYLKTVEFFRFVSSLQVSRSLMIYNRRFGNSLLKWRFPKMGYPPK